jgi:hypothetical protein
LFELLDFGFGRFCTLDGSVSFVAEGSEFLSWAARVVE